MTRMDTVGTVPKLNGKPDFEYASPLTHVSPLRPQN